MPSTRVFIHITEHIKQSLHTTLSFSCKFTEQEIVRDKNRMAHFPSRIAALGACVCDGVHGNNLAEIV